MLWWFASLKFKLFNSGDSFVVFYTRETIYPWNQAEIVQIMPMVAEQSPPSPAPHSDCIWGNRDSSLTWTSLGTNDHSKNTLLFAKHHNTVIPSIWKADEGKLTFPWIFLHKKKKKKSFDPWFLRVRVPGQALVSLSGHPTDTLLEEKTEEW